MIQTALLPDCDAQDRWQPVVRPYRLRPAIEIRRTKPLPGQMLLPGMEPTEDDGRSPLPPDEDDLAPCEEPSGGTGRPQPTCPNCGGTEFERGRRLHVMLGTSGRETCCSQTEA